MRTKVTVSNRPQVITVAAGSGSTTLAGLSDVDMSAAGQGAVLQYDQSSQTWVARNVLEDSGLTINAGFY